MSADKTKAGAGFIGQSVPRPNAKRLLEGRGAYVDDLRVPPGNRLESLKQDRQGQHSIRINDQWRICFVWKSDGAHSVEIVDYH